MKGCVSLSSEDLVLVRRPVGTVWPHPVGLGKISFSYFRVLPNRVNLIFFKCQFWQHIVQPPQPWLLILIHYSTQSLAWCAKSFITGPPSFLPRTEQFIVIQRPSTHVEDVYLPFPPVTSTLRVYASVNFSQLPYSSFFLHLTGFAL